MELLTRNLGMVYPNGKRALEDFSADLSSPSMIGLLGPNGAGKSTLMKLLVAGLMPTAGDILVDGKPLSLQEKRLKAGLGYLPQSFGLYDELRVWQFIDYMAALKGIPAGERRRQVERAVAAANLTELRKARIGALSGGQRQRVGIAQALLGNPELLILDEPTVGLDPEERIHFRNLFSDTARDKTVILSTHIIEDIQSVCGRLLVLYQGKLRFDGPPEDLIRAAQGHVGILEGAEEDDDKYQVTARLNTVRGVSRRVVAEKLPPRSEPVEPTLEDAYMYLISREAVA